MKYPYLHLPTAEIIKWKTYLEMEKVAKVAEVSRDMLDNATMAAKDHKRWQSVAYGQTVQMTHDAMQKHLYEEMQKQMAQMPYDYKPLFGDLNPKDSAMEKFKQAYNRVFGKEEE
jgi:hypothetical protein